MSVPSRWGDGTGRPSYESASFRLPAQDAAEVEGALRPISSCRCSSVAEQLTCTQLAKSSSLFSGSNMYTTQDMGLGEA